jgi:hypothetical protein
MENLDIANGFSINSNSTEPDVSQKQEKPQMNAQTKKAEANLVQKEIVKTMKGDVDNVKVHQEHCLMLSRYGSSPRFGEYLKSLSFVLTPIKLRKLKLEQLEELLERVRTSVANKTVSDIWNNSITSGLGMIENVCTMTRLNDTIKLKGLTEMLKEDENFLDLLEELKLNNQNLAYVSPYTRLAYTLLSSIFHVHGLNTMLDKRKPKPQNTVELPVQLPVEQHVEQPVEQEKKISTKNKTRERIYEIE